MAQDKSYISQRIVNTCLRENVCQIISRGEIITAAQFAHNNVLDVQSPHWLLVSHLGEYVLYIPVVESHYMQAWQAVSDAWLKKDKQGVVSQSGFDLWLTTLAENLDAGARQFFNDYIKEAECAVEHRKLCLQAYQEQTAALSKPLYEIAHWHQKLLLSDQAASYLDHPYYPTARAKFGFDKQALSRYAPEFGASFTLNWAAVANDQATLTSAQPDCWPTFAQVGLDASMALTHQLFPVHPLTFKTLSSVDKNIVLAPKSALQVTATLSVRTVVVEQSPDIHIKVPLVMATLGARNVRLIKASTIYDGHWFEKVLTQLAADDPKLQGLYQHCSEEHGGHQGEIKEIAYIVRQYPGVMHDKTLVPVAALGSEMPDKRLYLQHLVDYFYQGDMQRWLDEYLSLLLSVHLRLWLKYGIALESNQQNAVLAFSHLKPLSLVMKDNDSARLLASRFIDSVPDKETAKQRLNQLIDQRILVDDEQALAQMFTTITLQLDIAAVFEAMAAYQLMPLLLLYKQLRKELIKQLDMLQREGIETQYARNFLLEAEYQPAKYLLSSGSLLSKSVSGASDINKFYGNSVPNFLHQNFLIRDRACR
ncbi:IucA/IucC family protein [Psychromonas aquimarina]|uniref:IucA/IucC family protein n=1 Tax=Psychromonas aquimarina TaxID=444919 RepID=UPI000426B876|nr:IucA/IucC family protein [Psychromonas aquimarina]